MYIVNMDSSYIRSVCIQKEQTTKQSNRHHRSRELLQWLKCCNSVRREKRVELGERQIKP